jgi:hypothetical protein
VGVECERRLLMGKALRRRVLPPVSKLTRSQTMYHFVSGYSAKVAGTEEGVTEPQATFSACFGGAFLVMHPYKVPPALFTRVGFLLVSNHSLRPAIGPLSFSTAPWLAAVRGFAGAEDGHAR